MARLDLTDKKPFGADIKQPRRIKLLRVGWNMIAAIITHRPTDSPASEFIQMIDCDLPIGTRVVRVHSDPMVGGFVFVLENEQWPEFDPESAIEPDTIQTKWWVFRVKADQLDDPPPHGKAETA